MDIEKLIEKFTLEYKTYRKVDHSLLIRRNFSMEEINMLVEVGVLKPVKLYDKNSAFANEISYIINL